VRVEWPTYQVQAGDTLFKLAQQAGSTVDEIVEANCLASRDTIFAGMILRVPPGLTSVFPTTIPDGQTPVLYPADQCFGAPFLRDYGVSVGERWRVSTHIEVLTVYDAGTGNTPTGLLDIGENFTVQAGPTCYTQQIGASLHHFRRWQIASVDRNLSGWIDEYDAYTEAFSIEPNPTAIKFTASPQLVYTGDPITLEWEVEGANEVYIFSYHSLHRFASGTVGDAPDGLPPVGSITVYAPVPLARIDFTLGFSPRDYGSVTVDIICTEAYFADPGDIHACPLGPVDTVQAAFQPFERGFMVWRPDLNSETVWVFVEGDPSSHVFIDDWQGEEIIFDEQPPDALFQPVRGFGKVWVENDWVQRSIGWATAEEQAYDMEIQKTQTAYNATHHLLSLPDGRLVSAGLYMGTSLVWSYTTRR
jgi:LysM repeat protein